MSIERSSDLTGNKTRDFPACSIVPQPTMLQHAPYALSDIVKYLQRNHISRRSIRKTKKKEKKKLFEARLLQNFCTKSFDIHILHNVRAGSHGFRLIIRINNNYFPNIKRNHLMYCRWNISCEVEIKCLTSFWPVSQYKGLIFILFLIPGPTYYAFKVWNIRFCEFHRVKSWGIYIWINTNILFISFNNKYWS
jgi:hypothetical protein